MASRLFSALGIFGRLNAAQEAYILLLQKKCLPLAEDSETFGYFLISLLW